MIIIVHPDGTEWYFTTGLTLVEAVAKCHELNRLKGTNNPWRFYVK